jgi:SWI/SNF-related matrix-associated actin-dependent regulator 1 of chromatin subfamily A
MVVFDESHYIKNGSSQRSKIALKLSRLARFVVLLTGTPLSRNQEVYTQISAISTIPLGPFWPYLGRFPRSDSGPGAFFAARYTIPEQLPGRDVFKFTRNKNNWELSLLLKSVMIRRTKKGVLSELPSKIRNKVAVASMTDKQRKFFDGQLETWKRSKDNDLASGHTSDVQLLRLVQKTSKIKIQHSLRYLKENVFPLIGDVKILLFCHYHDTLDQTAAFCELHSVGFVQIDGRTSSKQKSLLVTAFKDDPLIRVAVLGIKSAGTGLNFQSANVVVFLELGWNDNDLLQAEDRAHRIGVQGDVYVTYLTLPGSTDDIMLRSLNSKHTNSTSVLESKKRNFLDVE